MKQKNFAIKNQTIAVDLILLLIRLVGGYAFILHGWRKIQNPLHWMGNQSTVPGVFQALAAISEFGGGIALILGLFTRLGAFGIACTMAVAVYTHSIILGDPFVNSKGSSYELATIYFLVALLIVVLGPGNFSLDKKIFSLKR
jgi:putative oxidoreductase